MSDYAKRLHYCTDKGRAARPMGGFTLIEMAVTIAILGILLAIAAPSYNIYFEKFRTKRAAETLVGTLIQAKTEAVKRNTPVSLVIKASNSGATWCYGLTTADDCDCTTANACTLDTGVETRVSGTDFKGITISRVNISTGALSELTSLAYKFDNVRGTTGANSVAFISGNNYQANTVVGSNGRIRTCSPSSNYIGGGYTKCD